MLLAEFIQLAEILFSNLKTGFSVKESAMFLNIAENKESAFLFDNLDLTSKLSVIYHSDITNLDYSLDFRSIGINKFTEQNCITFSNRESNFIKYGLKFVSITSK